VEKIVKLDVIEREQGCSRDTMITVKELLGYELGNTGLFMTFGPTDIEDIEYYISSIEQPRFNDYKDLIFVLNDSPYQIDPHKKNLGILKLMKIEH
jgi:hypothetical protein